MAGLEASRGVVEVFGAPAGTMFGTAMRAIAGERFRLFAGGSGRRYVFTRLEDGHDPTDLDGAVVVIARATREGPRPLWIGSAERTPRDLAPGVEIWAHWLAETAAARGAAVADLVAVVEPEPRPASVAVLRLAA